MNDTLFGDLLREARHMENRAFSTLGNFLTANSFVFVAWATFYVAPNPSGTDWILALLAIAGYVGGLAWALLGARNWAYCRRFGAALTHTGGSYTPGHQNLYQIMRGIEEAVQSGRDKLGIIPISYNANALSGTPLVVSVLYMAMLCTLLVDRGVTVFDCARWLVPVTTVIVGFVLILNVAAKCRDYSKSADAAVEEVRKLTAPG